MTALDTYLSRHYLNQAQLCAAAQISPAELEAMVSDRLVPGPSYRVSQEGAVRSFVFGAMEAPGSAPGAYFHPAQEIWIDRAREALAEVAAPGAHERLRERFCANFGIALATLNLALWRMADSFDDQGAPIAEGLLARTTNAWEFFLNGTFGLCVANPISEAHIACKEVLQEKLAYCSENGRKSVFTAVEAGAIHGLIDAYADATMPFSPIEYRVSSRKRLVEDLLAAMPVPLPLPA
jgi:hypothetical protein